MPRMLPDLSRGTVEPVTDVAVTPVRSPLRHLDTLTLGVAVRAEVRARQHHLPPVSVYRWWARRTETITGAVIDGVALDNVGRLRLADPFAGGGVIALAGLLRGHQVYAQDVNPWAARSLATMLTLPPPDVLDAASRRLHETVASTLTRAYATTFADGTPATLAHTFRVATTSCPVCDMRLRLFPTATVSLLTRIDCGGHRGWVACPEGHLHLADTNKRSSCPTCGRYVRPKLTYTPGRVVRCVNCRWTGKTDGLTLSWQVVLVERTGGGRREIAEPTVRELAAATTEWKPRVELAVIAPGRETSVLLRHGMRAWHDLYPTRQRVVIEALLDAIPAAAAGDERVEAALHAAVLGSVEMAGHASRWDARYLKAYEAIANHRYNFTTFSAEPNVWGAPESGRGTVDRRLVHLAKAGLFLHERIGRMLTVDGPLAPSHRRSRLAHDVRIVEGSSERLVLPAAHLHAVVTDPPYADDVQYGELSDLFRAWAGISTGVLQGDAVVRAKTGSAGLNEYQRLLTTIFAESRRALRADGHLIVSYANRDPDAWVALFSALQNARFRAVGCEVVPSENDVDHAKSGKRACTLDVLIDLVPAGVSRVYQHHPGNSLDGDEADYCRLVGDHALRIGHLAGEWALELVAALRATRFLARLADSS